MSDILAGKKFDVLVGDALTVLRTLPAGTFHCCVTSPPYYGLRSYLPAENVDKGKELGCEALHDCGGWVTGERCGGCYVCHMTEVFSEVRRVLRVDGTFWLNIGDKSSSSGAGAGSGKHVAWTGDVANGRRDFKVPGVPAKNLLGVPWRLALSLQESGWYLRQECIWYKPNPMTDSAADRPGRNHEQVFLLAKSSRYFYDREAVKQAAAPATVERSKYAVGFPKAWMEGGTPVSGGKAGHNVVVPCDGTANLRTVWKFGVASTKGAHFAVMPTALAQRCILAGTSEHGCCPACGAPWVRQVKRGRRATRPGKDTKIEGTSAAQHGNRDPGRHVTDTETIGWKPSCTCPPADPRPCLILDPFAGACTSLLAAARLGRRALGIELSAEYAAMGLARVAEELAKPPGKPKKPRAPRTLRPEPTLFDGVGDLT